MAVIILQCSFSLSDRPHPLHLFLHLPFDLSSLHLHRFLIRLPFAKLFLFPSLSSLPLSALLRFLSSYLTHPPPSSSWQHPSLLPQNVGWVNGCCSVPVTPDRPHLIITAHALYSIPSSVSDYNRVHGPTYQLRTKARNVKGVATCLRCQLSQGDMQTSFYSLWLYLISIQMV